MIGNEDLENLCLFDAPFLNIEKSILFSNSIHLQSVESHFGHTKYCPVPLYFIEGLKKYTPQPGHLIISSEISVSLKFKLSEPHSGHAQKPFVIIISLKLRPQFLHSYGISQFFLAYPNIGSANSGTYLFTATSLNDLILLHIPNDRYLPNTILNIKLKFLNNSVFGGFQ